MGGWDETDDLPPPFANSLTATNASRAAAYVYAAPQEEVLDLNMVSKHWYHGRIENCM